ncbi:MAG: ATP-binding cassette domain-containing protein, partial [Deltaproteobacteria bacterium]|nr:ATP-binding cassette domain-containing protein [Deltaproteobacteria bacterium]
MQLKTENLVKIYNHRTVVNDASFYLSQGEVVGLLGANGAGKTTSFYMVVGIVRPNQGRILMDQQDITRLA